MSAGFTLFPTVTESQILRTGYETQRPILSYTEDYEEFPLVITDDNSSSESFSGAIKDERCTWHPETHNLKINRKYRLSETYPLFGESGIAPIDATVGIALQWISTKSNERGVIPVGTFTKADYNIEFNVEHTFESGKLRGSLKLKTVLYLKEAGLYRDPSSFQARVPGSILGELDQCELFLDGNGSIFPIVVIQAPGKPLWEVYYNEYADPMDDSFDGENVEIRLNQSHPDYKLLKIETSISKTPLFLQQ